MMEVLPFFSLQKPFVPWRSSEHLKSSFDNPVGKCSVKPQNFAQSPKKKKP